MSRGSENASLTLSVWATVRAITGTGDNRNTGHTDPKFTTPRLSVNVTQYLRKKIISTAGTFCNNYIAIIYILCAKNLRKNLKIIKFYHIHRQSSLRNWQNLASRRRLSMCWHFVKHLLGENGGNPVNVAQTPFKCIENTSMLFIVFCGVSFFTSNVAITRLDTYPKHEISVWFCGISHFIDAT